MKKILLIQQNQEVLKNTSEILRLADYEVIIAENGMEGVELATREIPDLIIADIQVPILDGFGVLKLLHRHPSLQLKPFVLICENDKHRDVRKAMVLGADDCLVKPFNEIELLETIECRLKKANVFFEQYAKMQQSMVSENHFSKEELLREFLEGRNVDHYNKGQRIYSEGNRAIKLFFITSGKVRLCKSSDEGKELVVQLIGPGEFLGHVALLQGGSYKDSAETMESTEVRVIPKQDFEEFINKCSCIGNWFNQMLANDIEGHKKRSVGLAYNSLRKKVADALLMLQSKYNTNPDIPFRIDLHRDDLAHIAGTATESLIRTLRDFCFEKLIEIDARGVIEIINEKRLRNIFNR